MLIAREGRRVDLARSLAQAKPKPLIVTQDWVTPDEASR
jgi:hypothetical protein